MNPRTHMKKESAVLPSEPFGTLPDGRETRLFTLRNNKCMTAKVSDFGATLVSVEVPDKDGKAADVILGYDAVAGYQGEGNHYLGATVGRFGNRIARGRFRLGGKEYHLATNNSPGGIPCHLHGGKVGFNRRLWSVIRQEAPGRIVLRYVSPDGEEGYPGELTAQVSYHLTDENELVWEATATTTAPTVVNLLLHSYWNLSGDPATTVNDHELTIFASRYLPTDSGLIPAGELAPVSGTPMDFTRPHVIGKRLGADFGALEKAGGYDHCWVLDDPQPLGLAPAARLRDPKSGRVMEIFTNQPGIQFYGGNHLDPGNYTGGNLPGKRGFAYTGFSALCLETQNFPDAPNQPGFPTSQLHPGETYRHVMVHRFTAG